MYLPNWYRITSSFVLSLSKAKTALSSSLYWLNYVMTAFFYHHHYYYYYCFLLEELYMYIVTCISDYRLGFGLDDWFYCSSYIHTTWDYRQYSAVADLLTFQLSATRALGFSVFTSHIMATDLSQSHCNFKSHKESSFHSLTTFLPLFCSWHLNSIYCSYPDRPASRIRLCSLNYYAWSHLLTVLL
jgi:hypothetical protein